MQEFVKYQHVEKYGFDETQGIEVGTCYVFPKIDGTNGSLWWDNGLQAGSRNRHLTLDNDNQGFMAWAVNDKNIIRLFQQYPYLRLYGEWLVPHTLKTYDDSSWRKFYVFDVMYNNGVHEGVYMPYEEYKMILDAFDIDYIPPIAKIEFPTYERLISLLEKNTFLIKDGGGVGEGIVIKNYNYRNKYGRVTWAKIVRNEFKAKHTKSETPELKEKKLVETSIIEKYVTESLIEKEFAKIQDWNSKKIPQLFNTVYHCLVTEEAWNFVKEHKNPTIDFGRLYYLTIEKIKTTMPNIFS